MFNQRNGSVSSNSSSRASSVFTGGSGVEWVLMKPSIINAFRAANCWDIVDPLNAAVIDGGGVPIIVEATFNEIEPSRAVLVEDRITQYDLDVTNNFNNRMAMIAHAAGVSGSTKASMRLDAEIEQGNRIFQRSNVLLAYDKSFEDKWKLWDSKKKAHADKVASAIKVFSEKLSPGPFAKCKQHVNLLNFKRAWYDLDKYYTADAEDGNTKQSVYTALSELTYDERSGLERHLTRLEELFAQTDNPDSEPLKLTYLYSSFRKSKCRDFAGVLSTLKTMNTTSFMIIADALHRRDTELKIQKGQVKRQFEQSNVAHEGGNKKAKSTSSMKRILKGNNKPGARKCNACGKPGHTAEKCWTVVPCSKCGELGHADWHCRTDGNEGGVETKDDSQNADAPVLKSMFANRYPSSKRVISKKE
jgi:hypothetical protein